MCASVLSNENKKWGGYDRCDAADPSCGPDGQLIAPEDRAVLPAPQLPEGLVITQEVELDIQVGKYAAGTLRIGLFGSVAPGAVRAVGELARGTYRGRPDVELYAASYAGGTVLNVERGESLEVGVEDFGVAYAKRRGLRKAPEDFEPPARPTRDNLDDSTFMGPSHGLGAGLVSIPRSGLDADFGLTLTTLPSPTSEKDRRVAQLDKKNVVIGAVLDTASMELLSRLDNLPVQRAYGKNGKPMLKVAITGTREAVRSAQN